MSSTRIRWGSFWFCCWENGRIIWIKFL